MISEERLLSTAEVGERMGVDEQTVRLWIKKGKLEALKVGRGWRIPRSALEAFLENAPKARSPRKRPVESSAGFPSFGELWLLAERRLLEERRILSSLNPFVTQVDVRTSYWRRLAESGQLSRDTLNYATEELDITARGFEVLVDAAVAEGWSDEERGLLRRVYKDIAGPYREAWTALMTTWAKGSSDTQGERRLRVVADQAVRRLDKAEEVLSAA
ncbi:MAG: helix-turn-helix domain-containing protein [Actinomycetota bacterium]|nr:helix-turn-helix domain-containing protein [Actinomycetota bacterium]